MHKIRLKILLITILPSMLMLGILSGYLLQSRSSDLEAQFQERGKAIASQLAAASLNGLLSSRNDILELLARETMQNNPDVSAIRFNDPNGLELVRLGKTRPDFPGFANRFDSRIAPSYEVKDFYQFVLDQPLMPDEQGRIDLGRVSVWLDPRQLIHEQQRLIGNTVTLALVSVLVIALLSILLSQRIARPLEALTRATRQLRMGRLDTRVPLDESGEVGELQKAFNEMAQEIGNASRTLHERIDQATRELQESMEILEIKNVELDLARKKALQANRVKSEFLASMSHEIRTPMNGILGFTSLLRKTPLNRTQLEYLATIETSAGNLLTIINDILDLSRLEAGKLKLEHKPFSLRQCVEDTVSLLAPMAHEKGLELVSFFYDDVPDHLLGDRTRIAQIITNLVNNAIKFTPEGEVVLRVMLEEEADRQLTLALSVTDTGIGIAPEDQESIFDTFVQGQTEKEQATAGTGLGLSICRRLVEAMGGSISLVSTPGKGSTFTCRLRMEVDHGLVDEQEQDVLFRGKWICLLESHPVSRQAIAGTLNALGVPVLCHDRVPDPQRPATRKCSGSDLLLLCLDAGQLGNMDHALRILRTTLKEGLPVVVLVSSSSREVMSRFIAAGAARCLSKPVKRAILRDVLADLLIPSARLERPTAAVAPGSTPRMQDSEGASALLEGKRVLIADDNGINRQLMQILLENLGARVLCAEDGQEALELAASQAPDLVMLDIHMPRLNGYEAAEAIRELSKGRRIPMIAMTADAMERTRQQLERSGFSAYLLKPIEEQELLRVLRQALLDDPEMPSVSGLAAMGSESPATQTSALPVRDEARALRIAGGSRSIADNLFSQFSASLPQELEQISRHVNRQQWEAAWQSIHRLLGAVAVCGVPAFGEALDRLQRAVQDEDRVLAGQCLDRVRAEARRLERFKPRGLEALPHRA